jgi:hypothetical protein
MPLWTRLLRREAPVLIREVPVLVRGVAKSVTPRIGLGFGGKIFRVGKLAVPAIVGAGVGYSIGKTGTLPFLPKPPHLPIPGSGSDHDSGKGSQFGSSILTYGLLFLAVILSLLLLRKKK